MSKTPILDREQAFPKRRMLSWQAVVGGVVLGVALIAADSSGFLSEGAPLQKLGAFVLCLYLVVLVHELGHAIAGAATGFELRAMVVGPLVLSKQARGWRIQFSPWLIFSGGAAMVAPRSNENLRGRFMKFAFGGPVATAVFIVVCILCRGGLWWTMLLAVNLLAAASSYLPYTLAGQPSDAKSILILARKGAAGDWLCAFLYLLALNERSIQPRDWPIEYVNKVRVAPNGIYQSSFHALECEFAAVGTTDEVAETLERALAESNKMRPSARRAFFLAAASFHGFMRGDSMRAQAWLDDARKVKGAVSQKDWDSKARAAILYAEGKISEANDFLVRYVAVLDRMPPTGLVAAERERVVISMGQLSGGKPVVS